MRRTRRASMTLRSSRDDHVVSSAVSFVTAPRRIYGTRLPTWSVSVVEGSAVSVWLLFALAEERPTAKKQQAKKAVRPACNRL